MRDISKIVQLYDLSRDKTIYEMPHYGDVFYMEGDELELPQIGAFKLFVAGEISREASFWY